MKRSSQAPLAICLALFAASATAQLGEVAALRATELRADKLPTAQVLRQVAPGTLLRALSLEGGWVWVDGGGTRGWVRASALDLRATPSVVATLPTSRTSGTSGIKTLGIRNLPARTGRHALVITVSRYKDPNTSSLPGARVDRESASQIAQSMQIPSENIRYLQDEEATGEAIRKALRELNSRVMEGDRVYIHFSGHGTRFFDPSANGCVEALMAHDGGWPGTITNREMAELLAPLSLRTDKLLMVYDACHSGGVVASDPQVRRRGISLPTDEGRLRPKFAMTTEECARPVNVKARNLLAESVNKGTLPQDIVFLSSSRDNEVSFDDEQKGGLATQFMRDCMLRDAMDLDGSGAITIEEVRACAQKKINERLENDTRFKPSTLVLTGNSDFVPAWFSVAEIAQTVAGIPPSQPPTAAADQAVTQLPPASPPVASPPAPATPQPSPLPAPPPASLLSGSDALKQLYNQRDAKRSVRATAAQSKLQINRDTLDLTVESKRKGYVYVAMAGSDKQSLYVLFPNELDSANGIDPGKPLVLPRPNWRVRAGGPAGTNELLVLVTDAPRDLSELNATKAGPFLKSLNDAAGRATLGALMTRTRTNADSDCLGPLRSKNPSCSDAFGAAMLQVEEIQPRQ